MTATQRLIAAHLRTYAYLAWATVSTLVLIAGPANVWSYEVIAR